MKKIFFIVIIFVGIFMTGCGDTNSTIQLPEEYRKPENFSDKISVDVYFDATVSMRGYTTLAAGNVYRTLPDILGDIGGAMGEVKFYSFGENIRELVGRDHRQFSSPEPYVEIITAVHNVIDKADENHLSIVVTDLFESEADWSNIAQKIRDKFFAKHLAVAIIGVKNSFNGEIFDVGLNAAQFQYDSADYPAKFRPFYLLIMGQESAVENFMQRFKERQTLPNETQYLLLSGNLSQEADDFSAMKLLTLENFFADEKINLADKTAREFGVDDLTEPAAFTANFRYNPPFGACLFDMEQMNSEMKIFALEGEDWQPLPNCDAEIILSPVEGAGNNYIVEVKIFPDECLRQGQINFVHVALTPTEGSYFLPQWVRDWNMANVDAAPANFDGSKTANLLRIVESLKDSIFAASRPALVNINFIVDLR